MTEAPGMARSIARCPWATFNVIASEQSKQKGELEHTSGLPGGRFVKILRFSVELALVAMALQPSDSLN